MKIYLITILTVIALHTFGQDSLKAYNNSRNDITATGMKVLGSWGIVNTGIGIAGWANSDGGSNKYFYQMTAIWGLANFGISILGYTNTQADRLKSHNGNETMMAQKRIEKTFLVNGGLDFVYIGAGAFLKHRGNTQNSAQLRGYGSSVIVQGVALLLFDATMYGAERKNGNKLRRFLERNPVGFNGKSVEMIYHIN